MKTWRTELPGAELEFVQGLLDSARDDDAPAEARARVAARLGIDPSRVDIGGPSSGRSSGEAFERGARARAEGMGADALIKYALIGIAGGLLTLSAGGEAPPAGAHSVLETTAIESVEPPAPPPLPPLVAESPPSTEATATLLEEPRQKTMTAARRASVPGTIALARRPRAEPERAPATSDPSSSELLAEVKQLDRVRAALEAADAPAALRELDAYAARFPRGALTVEALVLRVRALKRVGINGLKSIGDVNGDGYADLQVTSAEGVHLLPGSAQRLSGDVPSLAHLSVPMATVEPSLTSNVGDVDRDGFDDLVVFLESDNVSTRYALYYGAPELLQQPVNGASANAIFAVPGRVPYIFSIGDWDGDGFNDLLLINEQVVPDDVQAPLSNVEVRLIPGKPERYSGSHPLSAADPDAAQTELRVMIARAAGDLDGDGKADLIFDVVRDGPDPVTSYVRYGGALPIEPIY